MCRSWSYLCAFRIRLWQHDVVCPTADDDNIFINSSPGARAKLSQTSNAVRISVVIPVSHTQVWEHTLCFVLWLAPSCSQKVSGQIKHTKCWITHECERYIVMLIVVSPQRAVIWCTHLNSRRNIHSISEVHTRPAEHIADRFLHQSDLAHARPVWNTRWTRRPSGTTSPCVNMHGSSTANKLDGVVWPLSMSIYEVIASGVRAVRTVWQRPDRFHTCWNCANTCECNLAQSAQNAGGEGYLWVFLRLAGQTNPAFFLSWHRKMIQLDRE